MGDPGGVNVIRCADNLTLVADGESGEEIEDKIEYAIELISDWMSSRSLQVALKNRSGSRIPGEPDDSERMPHKDP